jgi:hypothetical protein
MGPSTGVRCCRSGRVWRPLVRRCFAEAHAEAQQRPQAASHTTIIDSQVHAYAANTPERPWNIVPNWPAHVTGDEMVAAMDKVGVDGAIYISPW